MPPYTTDTAPDAEAIQLRQIALLPPRERVRIACDMSRRGRRMAFDAIRRRHPQFTADEILLTFIGLAHGPALANDVRRWQQGRSL